MCWLVNFYAVGLPSCFVVYYVVGCHASHPHFIVLLITSTLSCLFCKVMCIV